MVIISSPLSSFENVELEAHRIFEKSKDQNLAELLLEEILYYLPKNNVPDYSKGRIIKMLAYFIVNFRNTSFERAFNEAINTYFEPEEL